MSLYESKGDLQKTLDHYRQQVALKEEMFNTEKSKQVTEMQTRYETEKNKWEADFLREKNKRMQNELDIAGQIQSSLLPDKVPVLKDLQIAGVCHPAREAGGDYFDYIPSPDGKRLYIVIADVSGKGVPACLMTIELRTLLHSLIANHLSPIEIVLQINKHIYRDTQRFGQPMMITMLMMCWDSEIEQLSYVNAAHDPFLIYRAEEKTVEMVYGGGMWLGIEENIHRFTREELLDIQPGDTILLYTDGITESHNVDNEEFGLDRLTAHFQAHPGQTPEESIRELIDEVSSFSKGKDQHDDIAIVAIKALED